MKMSKVIKEVRKLFCCFSSTTDVSMSLEKLKNFSRAAIPTQFLTFILSIAKSMANFAD
jgi:hypothetical protein